MGNKRPPHKGGALRHPRLAPKLAAAPCQRLAGARTEASPQDWTPLRAWPPSTMCPLASAPSLDKPPPNSQSCRWKSARAPSAEGLLATRPPARARPPPSRSTPPARTRPLATQPPAQLVPRRPGRPPLEHAPAPPGGRRPPVPFGGPAPTGSRRPPPGTWPPAASTPHPSNQSPRRGRGGYSSGLTHVSANAQPERPAPLVPVPRVVTHGPRAERIRAAAPSSRRRPRASGARWVSSGRCLVSRRRRGSRHDRGRGERLSRAWSAPERGVGHQPGWGPGRGPKISAGPMRAGWVCAHRN